MSVPKNSGHWPNIAGDSTALARPSISRQRITELEQFMSGKLETLSGGRCAVATVASLPHRHFRHPPFRGPANAGTMHESGQTVLSGPEDKRQPWSAVTTD